MNGIFPETFTGNVIKLRCWYKGGGSILIFSRKICDVFLLTKIIFAYGNYAATYGCDA